LERRKGRGSSLLKKREGLLTSITSKWAPREKKEGIASGEGTPIFPRKTRPSAGGEKEGEALFKKKRGKLRGVTRYEEDS